MLRGSTVKVVMEGLAGGGGGCSLGAGGGGGDGGAFFLHPAIKAKRAIDSNTALKFAT